MANDAARIQREVENVKDREKKAFTNIIWPLIMSIFCRILDFRRNPRVDFVAHQRMPNA